MLLSLVGDIPPSPLLLKFGDEFGCCRHPTSLEEIVRGLGDIPLIHLRIRRSNCRSRLCDAVVSGSHFLPTQR
jgi:hypothetical protein